MSQLPIETQLQSRLGLPDLGVGVGLRVPHYPHIFREQPTVDFFEILSENFLVPGGRPGLNLERILQGYRVVQHGVSLGLGGPEPLDREYLRQLKILARQTKTPWVSDHFCWSGAGDVQLHDLLPLPYTPETVARLVERARMVQDILETPLLLENTSSYLTYRANTLSEWDFISEIAERAEIGLLFDLNNVWVSSYNHGFDPIEFVRGVPHARIVQIHLASPTSLGHTLIDTHRGPVIDPVLQLYRLTIELAGSVSTCIEWDNEIPPFPVLAAEAERARGERNRALAARSRNQSSVDSKEILQALAEARAAAQSGSDRWPKGGLRETTREALDRDSNGSRFGGVTEQHDLQRFMARVLRQRRALPGDPEISRLAAVHFTGNEQLSPVARLEIYRQQFWLRHSTALVEDFPGVGGILGQGSWERLVEEYLEAHPPTGFSLRDLGAKLADFIANQAPWLPVPELIHDVACLEWAYVEAFDAGEAGPLTPERLHALDEAAWNEVRLVLAPSLRLLRLRYPVVELCRQLREKPAEAPDLPNPDPRRLVVHRVSGSIRTEALDEAPFALLEAVSRGRTLPEACAAACREAPDPPETTSSRIATWFELWVRRGWIADVRT